MLQDASEPAPGRGPAKLPPDLGSASGREAILARELAELPPGADYGTVLQGQLLSGKAITRCVPRHPDREAVLRGHPLETDPDMQGFPD